MRSRRILTLVELPTAMARVGASRHHQRFRPVIQFIMDWNDHPGRRGELFCGGAEPPGTHPYDMTLLAAVVHGLCNRDDIPVPDWVHSYRLTPPLTLAMTPIDTDWGRCVVSAAPAVCTEHGIFFDADLLESA